MQAILDAIRKGTLKANPVIVISNNSNSTALKRAAKENVPSYHLSSKTHADPKELDTAMLNLLHEKKTDLVILAGYMKKIGKKTLDAFENRILNIHPALLPKYGGKGMYGKRVHEAVLEAGEAESGVTVHLVDGIYDNGPILSQEKVPVKAGDTAESLAERVLKCEHEIYAKTIAGIVSGEIILPDP